MGWQVVASCQLEQAESTLWVSGRAEKARGDVGLPGGLAGRASPEAGAPAPSLVCLPSAVRGASVRSWAPPGRRSPACSGLRLSSRSLPGDDGEAPDHEISCGDWAWYLEL